MEIFFEIPELQVQVHFHANEGEAGTPFKNCTVAFMKEGRICSLELKDKLGDNEFFCI